MLDVNAPEEDATALYAWEGTYERPWEAVVTASDGTLHGASSRRHHMGISSAVRVGVRRAVMRSVVLVIDASVVSEIADPDMRPSRLGVMTDAASTFVREFFEQNPISTLSVITVRDGRAEQRDGGRRRRRVAGYHPRPRRR